MAADQLGGTPLVVLLRERGLPSGPGVCCWRRSAQAAFEAAGARVETAEMHPVSADAPVEGQPGTGRAARLPRVIRRPAVVAYHGARKVSRGIAREVKARSTAQRRAREAILSVIARLERADLVLAETVGVAEAALAAGLSGRVLWALAAFPERLTAPPVEEGYPAQLARIAGRVGGLLADSELGRESVERASSAQRPRVEVFPPLASDRFCPDCGSEPSGSMQDGSVSPFPTWRRLIHSSPADDAEPAYSFAAARLLGQATRWAPAELWDWTQSTRGRSQRIATAEQPEPWTAARQDAAAARVLGAALPVRVDRATRRVLVSGYDLKFVRELAGRLDNRTDLDVTLDAWPYLGHRSPETDRLLANADTVFAEWARPSAVWLSRNKRPGQRLIVRLHRYELDCPYPRDIDIDAVDAVVHVSPPIRARILDELGWPADKLVYIPNFLDTAWLDRPKLPGARFGIGMVGIEFMNKRFDLALDILSAVRRADPRFTLHVRSVMPWDNVYAWPRPAEREYVGWCLERIDRDPLLRGAVQFDAPGRDMARWYRKVGHVLSMSDIESFHLAAAEGMASGAVPVIRPWPGATEIYGAEWIHQSVEAAEESILTAADEEIWAAKAARAREEIRRSVEPGATVEAWADLVHGDIERARSRFAQNQG